MREIKGYQCEFCKKLYQMKHACLKHETIKCSKNPINKHPCYSCPFLEVGEGEYLIENICGDESYRKQKTFHCTKLNKNLYSHKMDEHIKSFDPAFENESLPVVRMPSEGKCEEFNEWLNKPPRVHGSPF